MKTILAVDDSVINLKSIKHLLSPSYKVVAVNSGRDALNYLSNARPDLILLDLMMPEMDGFQVTELLKKDPKTETIPIIFLTADEDTDKEVQGFRMGAMDFIRKPFEPDIVLSRIAKALELESLRHDLESQVQRKTREIESITLQSYMAIADMVDGKDHYSKGHSRKVAALSEEIARRLGWDENRITDLHYCALLHDIGKIAMPDSILNKPDTYTREEQDLIKQHTTLGAELLGNITIPNARAVILSHHERFDGTGYPQGIKGEAIPIEARIISIADAYDAMSNDRSYRLKYSSEYVRDELLRCSGTQFDPNLVPIMLSLMDENFADSLEEAGDSLPIQDTYADDPTSLLHQIVKKVTNEVQTEASKDVLTGLWNRKYALDAVDQLLLMPRSKGTAFMMDLDNFKGINDTFGHIFGDEVLINISKVLDEIVRSGDIACRIGGDEFFIYFNELSRAEDIENLAIRLIHILNERVICPNGNGITVSVGIARAPQDGESFEELYAKADKALYHAKNNGKNSFHFYTEDSETTDGPESIREDLDSIRRMLSEEEPIVGSYYVEYESFKNISRFIRRNVERKQREVVYILFTITGRKGTALPAEETPLLMKSLEGAIHDSLRIGDVATRYSSTQMLVILMDTNEENSQMVATRIFGNFVQRISQKDIELHYDMQKLDK